MRTFTWDNMFINSTFEFVFDHFQCFIDPKAKHNFFKRFEFDDFQVNFSPPGSLFTYS